MFARAEFVKAVDQAANDLRSFLGPLRRWLDEHAPAQAADFVAHFEKAFVFDL